MKNHHLSHLFFCIFAKVRKFRKYYINRFKILRKYFPENKQLNILDVGCGNHSATITKSIFPNCLYYGLDRQSYNNAQSDYSVMEHFYNIDANSSEFDEIPDNYFDIIIMSHIIEHLTHGDQTIKRLLKKIKKGGWIYIEYPGVNSLRIPSMKEPLNFFDDSSHCRIYTNIEILNILMNNGLKIVRFGIHRNIFNIAIIPLHLIYNLVNKGYVSGCVFWDLFGFAEFVLARKSAD